MKPDFGLYSILDRGFLRKSLAGKLTMVALILVTPALVSLVIAVLQPGIASGMMLIGGGITLLLLVLAPSMFRSVLKPVQFTRDVLERYADHGQVEELPSNHADLAGGLMTQANKVLVMAGQAKRQQDVDATTDPLTGLLNRRAATRRLGSDLLRAMRDGRPLCLAAAEIENAESLIAQFGHDAMNGIVQVVAQKICSSLRRSDWVAHLGNNEFMIGLWGAGFDHADIALRRMIVDVDSNPKAPVHLNIGVAQSMEEDTPDRITALAVSAMVRARKTTGSAIEYETEN